MTASAPDAPGFFGKLPGFPDFLSRRLPRSFVDPWDAWLQQGILSSRERLGVSWLDTYLTSPIWRFLLSPSVCGAGAWTGVLMPSVDRVGRHFPLTVVADLPREIGALPMLAETPWFERLEQLALSTLDEPFDLDAFDAQLQQLKPSLTLAVLVNKMKGTQNDAVSWCFGLTSGASLAQSLPAIAESLLDGRLERQTFWWTSGSEKVRPCILTCKGLPISAAFAALLDGNWARWGWVSWL
ncbi:MAG TPA: type VI secretion system-associated protein TagF [Burkholderiales bacterium]|nr:type VI secretion system-associated protein TagF [Burkholderiales bacterium]